MRLFKRKQRAEDEVACCLRCGEPLPEGAVECMMCGVASEPLREPPSNEHGKPQPERRVAQ